ncbi:septation ring formation regulator EzrA [Staphylococcus saprophyticus]|jgi:septation ring formation regulator|uniref:septation ring formation regulator EzrA n=1 Tax=Staphylococcus saprophyticus TaxID=29385 RepID=UPI0007B551DE|nr:septation ring formation regulator EzrA [Staphylococcus saprophyticus]MBC2920610.1 septation ring formation regulator EzrA [Staphylococcus saprophyticus]MBC2956314.1 septation ring formation regulator EzrA [Staphylococcus saprophyticus]MBC3009562.1 septation ring formation regulator EzrA [Staphylococcus saprophyticus]MBC3023441.1 septation ring formation regulator EzrA [Staphylococcus saprophyticus]MBC3029298.1 septation ring formation regulator EzrA [Staphylococcus saprophyticus]
MVLYIVLAIIFIILIIVGVLFYMRSNKSQMIEKTEERKHKVEQLPYDESLSQLTEFNLTGETKSTYDRLKQSSLDSKNQYLLPVEEKIHDAEGLLDKFKFSQAQTEVDEAHEMMDQYEANYNELTTQVEEIIGLHKQSDHLYNECKTDYREMKRDVLANRHQFGEAASPLEQEIESFVPEMETYETLKSEGNFNQAHDHIKTLNDDMNYLKTDMDEIPDLIKEAQKELPGQFQDIKYGCRDLKVEGYDLDHVKIDSTLQTLKTELSFVEPMISRLELDEANEKLNSINDRLDEMYELIELEVKAKNDVEETKEVITDNLFRAKEMNYTLQTEIEYVRENYYINESDVQNVRQFENEIQNMISVYDEILREMAKSAVRYSEVQDNLKYIEEHVAVINEKQEKLQNHLIQLREDEAEAEENILRVQSKKEEVYRKLLASNLPSVPERFIIMKNEIDYEVREVNKKFSVRPIHVKQLKDKVSKVVLQMNKFDDEATDVLVNAVYAEKLIEYGNRYRKDSSNIDKSLNEAERLFKNNRYKRSIEISEQALERVEPGITKQIESKVIG